MKAFISTDFDDFLEGFYFLPREVKLAYNLTITSSLYYCSPTTTNFISMVFQISNDDFYGSFHDD